MEEENKKYQISEHVISMEGDTAQKDKFEEVESSVSFSQRLFEKTKSFKGSIEENENDIKIIMAFNMLAGREFTQLDRMPLDGADEVVSKVSNKTLLTNNNLTYQDLEVATENSVYVFINPSDYLDDNFSSMSYVEKIKRTIEPYEENEIRYKLYIYINTNSYNEHKMFSDDLKESLSIDYEIITYVKADIYLREEAEIIVEEKPNVYIDDLVDNFYQVFDLFRARRKKVYFDVKYDSSRDPIGSIDFLLLAYRYLSQLLVSEHEKEAMAREYTSLWLNNNRTFKFIHEDIEDFFNCPTTVRVNGLSPFFGTIVGKRIHVKGKVVAEDESTAPIFNEVIKDASNIFGFTEADAEELSKYLVWNTKNLRKDLIRIKDEHGDDYVIRVESLDKEILVKGINSGYNQRKFATYTIKGNFDNVTLTTPYFLARSYELLRDSDLDSKFIKYQLPDRFTEYLKRKAYAKNHPVKEIDTTWFTSKNNVLSDILSELGEFLYLEEILKHSISSTNGLDREKIIVDMKEIKCRTKEKSKAL